MADDEARLVRLHQANQTINKGANVREDSWVALWCSSNWGELLQPAPLALALLGSVIAVASTCKDFSLKEELPGVPSFEWKVARHPESFKTCLQQMVGDGYEAFGTAHREMESIMNQSSMMPDLILTLVKMLFEGDPDEVRRFFPQNLRRLEAIALRCKDSAEKCQKGFQDLSELAQELVTGCTYVHGTREQALAANEIHIQVLETERQGTEQVMAQTQQSLEQARESFGQSQQGFRDAVNSMPSGMQLVGINSIESLTELVTFAGHAFVSSVTLVPQLTKKSISLATQKFGGKKSKEPDFEDPSSSRASTSAVPNHDALSDPALQLVPLVLTYAKGVEQLISGGPGGKPDWSLIGSTEANETGGGEYLRKSLMQQTKRLEKGKPMSEELGQIIGRLISIVDSLITSSKSGGNDSVVEPFINEIPQLVEELETMKLKALLITQSPPSLAPGFAASNPPHLYGKAAQIAVQSAKFKIDLSKEVLDSARLSYDKQCEIMTKQQMDMARTIGELAKHRINSENLREMIPVLKRAVASFGALRAQVSQLVQFFDSIASLVKDVMVPSAQDLIEVLTSAEDMVLGGTSLKSFTKNLIYNQTQVPLKVAMLANKVSTVYVTISSDHIMPMQRFIGQLNHFPDSDEPAARIAFENRVWTAQMELRQQAEHASRAIVERIREDQQEFSNVIQKRLKVIENETAMLLPPTPAPKHLTNVAHEYVEQMRENKENEKENESVVITMDDL